MGIMTVYCHFLGITMAMSPFAVALNELSVESFRVTSRLNQAADGIARELGLSSARWQVLTALELAGKPLTVAAIARLMGLKRQSVQRTADALVAQGFLEFRDNPAHRRARLAALTERSLGAMRALNQRRQAWAAELNGEIPVAELKEATKTLIALRKLLENS